MSHLDRSDLEDRLLGVHHETPEEIEQRERDAAEAALVRQRFLSGLMGSLDFRAWLMELLVEFGTFENAFGMSANGAPDPMGTQFKLGMKAAGWHLWTIFDAAEPLLANQMRREWRPNPAEPPPRVSPPATRPTPSVEPPPLVGDA